MAKSLFLNDTYKRDLNQIDSLLTSAFEMQTKSLSVDLFFALKVYSSKCDKERFMFISKKLISNGVDSKKVLKLVPDCISKKEVLGELRLVQSDIYNLDLYNMLDQVLLSDYLSQKPYVSNKSRNRINRDNYNIIKIITEQNNSFPSVKLTGRDLIINHVDISDDFLQALLHFSIEEIEYLLPYLLTNVENNELSPYHFARIYDYYYIKKTAMETLGKQVR